MFQIGSKFVCFLSAFFPPAQQIRCSVYYIFFLLLLFSRLPTPPNPERLLHIQASALTGFSPLLVCLVGFTHSSAVLPVRHLTHSVPINMHEPLLSASSKLSQQPPFPFFFKFSFIQESLQVVFLFFSHPALIHLFLLLLCVDSH